jgi:DNA-binding Lrp family transcriptional regulator
LATHQNNGGTGGHHQVYEADRSQKLSFSLLAFIQIKIAQQLVNWARLLAQTLVLIPQLIELYPMSGNRDYLIQAWVAKITDYDRLE